MSTDEIGMSKEQGARCRRAGAPPGRVALFCKLRLGLEPGQADPSTLAIAVRMVAKLGERAFDLEALERAVREESTL